MTAFLLDEMSSKASFRAAAERPDSYDPFEVKRGASLPRAALRFRWKMGSKNAGHLVWTDAAEILVSQPFVDALAGLSGWKALPIVLEGDRRRASKNYYYLVVDGRCGAFLQEKTAREPRSDRAFDLYRGLCFTETQSKPDFSMPSNPSIRFVFVTERARVSIAALKCSSVALTPCEQVLLHPWVYVALLEKTGQIGTARTP